MAMGSIRSSVAVVAIVTTALIAWGVSGPSLDAKGQERSVTPATRSSIVALAKLLPATGLIEVGIRPGIRVVELKVKEGDDVSAGDLLAILEGHDAARIQLDLVLSKKERADHDRAARLAAASKAAESSRRRYNEAKKLYDQFGATLKGKDRYDAELALYQVEMQAIRTQLDLELAQGPKSKDLDGTIGQAEVDLAASSLRATEIHAPSAGRILRTVAEPGEISSGVLLVMGNLSSMVAKAEVYQADIPRIQPGDPAEVVILGTRVAGRVTRVGAIVGQNQLVNLDPRAPRDLRIVEVTILLERTGPASQFVEMEVDSEIHPAISSGSSR